MASSSANTTTNQMAIVASEIATLAVVVNDAFKITCEMTSVMKIFASFTDAGTAIEHDYRFVNETNNNVAWLNETVKCWSQEIKVVASKTQDDELIQKKQQIGTTSLLKICGAYAEEAKGYANLAKATVTRAYRTLLAGNVATHESIQAAMKKAGMENLLVFCVA